MALVELLTCPVCRGPLTEAGSVLRSEGCGRTFPWDGATADLRTSAPAPDSGVLGSDRLYDAVQWAFGRERILRRVRPITARGGVGGTVLDVGAGTGALRRALPDGAEYIWLDNDPRKLHGFRRSSAGPALLADATHIPVADGSVDWTVCSAVAHHLDDAGAADLVDELARVSRRGVIFLEPLASDRPVARALWGIDRGSHPRPLDALTEMLRSRFELTDVHEFAVFHRYLLAVGKTA